jgi:hypothetical protein
MTQNIESNLQNRKYFRMIGNCNHHKTQILANLGRSGMPFQAFGPVERGRIISSFNAGSFISYVGNLLSGVNGTAAILWSESDGSRCKANASSSRSRMNLRDNRMPEKEFRRQYGI